MARPSFDLKAQILEVGRRAAFLVEDSMAARKAHNLEVAGLRREIAVGPALASLEVVFPAAWLRQAVQRRAILARLEQVLELIPDGGSLSLACAHVAVARAEGAKDRGVGNG